MKQHNLGLSLPLAGRVREGVPAKAQAAAWIDPAGCLGLSLPLAGRVREGVSAKAQAAARISPVASSERPPPNPPRKGEGNSV
jgi:hypothetical protein